MKITKVVLAYSADSILLSLSLVKRELWLEVVAPTWDKGKSPFTRKAAWASKVYIEDLRKSLSLNTSIPC